MSAFFDSGKNSKLSNFTAKIFSSHSNCSHKILGLMALGYQVVSPVRHCVAENPCPVVGAHRVEAGWLRANPVTRTQSAVGNNVETTINESSIW